MFMFMDIQSYILSILYLILLDFHHIGGGSIMQSVVDYKKYIHRAFNAIVLI